MIGALEKGEAWTETPGKTWRCEQSYIYPTHIRKQIIRYLFVTTGNGKHVSYNAHPSLANYLGMVALPIL